MRLKPFEYIVLLHPDQDKDGKDVGDTQVIVERKFAMAKDDKTVAMVATRAIPDAHEREWTLWRRNAGDSWLVCHGDYDTTQLGIAETIHVVPHSRLLEANRMLDNVMRERDEAERQRDEARNAQLKMWCDVPRKSDKTPIEVSDWTDLKAQLASAEKRIAEYEKRFGPLETVPRLIAKQTAREWWAVLSISRNEGTIAPFYRSVQYEQNVEHVCVVERSALDKERARAERAEAELETRRMNQELAEYKRDKATSDNTELTNANVRLTQMLAQAYAELETLRATVEKLSGTGKQNV